MENNKHTPGKWGILIQPMTNGTGRTINVGSKRIATLEHTGDIEESEANAKLISKSPEMLWLLGWIVNEIETTPNELSDALLGLIKIKCNQTIKKATNQ